MTIDALNPVQQQMLGMLANGRSYAQMVKELGRSYESVKKDFEIIRQKTQIKSRVSLALFAVAMGYATNPYACLHVKEVPPKRAFRTVARIFNASLSRGNQFQYVQAIGTHPD